MMDFIPTLIRGRVCHVSQSVLIVIQYLATARNVEMVNLGTDVNTTVILWAVKIVILLTGNLVVRNAKMDIIQ